MIIDDLAKGRGREKWVFGGKACFIKRIVATLVNGVQWMSIMH